MDTSGKIHDKNFTFDYIGMKDYTPWLVAGKNHRFGILNYFTDTIASFEYDTAIAYRDIFAIQKGNEWTLLTSLSNDKLIINADSIKVFWDYYLFYYSGTKCGITYYDIINNKFIKSSLFDRIMPFHNGFLTYDNSKFGFLDVKFKTILEPSYSEVQIDYYGNIFYWDGYWKYVVRNERYLDPGKKSRISFYSDNVWKLRDNNNQSQLFSTHSDNPVLPGYENYFYLGNDLVVMRSNGKSGLGTLDNKIYFQPKYDFVGSINDTLFYYKKDSLLGLINIYGTQLTEAKFTDIENGVDLLSDFLKVNINGKYGVLNKQGRTIVTPEYNNIGVFFDGFVTENANTYGFINKEGKKIADTKYRGFNVYYQDYTVRNKGNQHTIFKFWDKNNFDFYNEKEKLNTGPCSDFNFSNKTLKCYCDEGIELIFLNDDFSINGRYMYKNIKSVTIRDTTSSKKIKFSLTKRIAVLEEDQVTGKYTMRFSEKKGYGFQPLFEQIYPTKYPGVYTGKLIKDTVNYELAGLLVYARQFDLGFSGSDGLLYTKDTLITSDYKYGSGLQSTSLDFQFNTKKEAGFISESKLSDSKISYMDRTEDALKMLYINGKLSITKNSKNTLNLWEYFHRYNQHNNCWFNDKKVIDSIMNPENHISFNYGEWRIVHGDNDNYEEAGHTRVFNGKQSFQYFEKNGFLSTHIFSEDGLRYGVISKFNDSILSLKYDTLYRRSSTAGDFLIGQFNSKAKYIYDLNLHTSFNNFIHASPYKDGYATVSNSTGSYVIDHNEKICIKNYKSSISYLGMSLFALKQPIKNNLVKYKLINSKGENKADTLFDHLTPAKNGRIIYTIGRNNGLIDSSGKIIIPHDYDSIRFINDKILYAYLRPEKFLLDIDGNKIRNLTENEKIKGEWIIGKKGKRKYHLENVNGTLLEYKSETEPKIYSNFFRIKERKGYAYYNNEGKLILRTKSSSAKAFTNGLIALRDKFNWIVFDENCNELNTLIAEEFNDFGVWISFSHGDTLRYLNAYGEIIEPEDNAKPVKASSEEKVICNVNRKFAFYDIQGNRISAYFDKAENFKNGYAAVALKNKWGFIDSTGKQVVKCIFENVSEVSEGKFIGDQLSKLGAMTYSSSNRFDVILPFIYSEIIPVNGKVFFRQENSSGYYFPDRLPDKRIIWPEFD